MKNDNRYGGVNPPYSLYQGEDGKWGLVNSHGKKLPAVFNNLGDGRYSCAPWEVVTFDPDEGFDLLAWYDPAEVWFNFTFNNPDYPAEYTKLLWKEQSRKLKDCSAELHELLPSDAHWLLDILLRLEELDPFKQEDEIDNLIINCLRKRKELHTPAKFNPLLYPVMQNSEIDEEIRITLWMGKITLDFLIMDILNAE